jgi:AcrR family transcriptional regulator
MDPKRLSKRRARARAEIVEAARARLLESGLAGFRLEDVAERLGLSKATLYYYFRSREELLRELVVEDVKRVTGILIEVVASASPDEVLPALVGAFVEHSELRLFRLTYMWTQTAGIDDERLNEVINPSMTEMFASIEAAIVEALGPGRRDEARRLGVTAWCSSLGLVTMFSMLDASGTRSLHERDALVKTLQGVWRPVVPG